MTDNTKGNWYLKERVRSVEGGFLAQGLWNEEEALVESVLRERGQNIMHLTKEDMIHVVTSSLFIDMAAKQGNIADWRDDKGKTLIHYVFRATGKELDKLISYGCDLNTQDNEGNTPLHDFVMMGDNDICRMLLKRGAALNIKNNKGETPIDIAALKRAKWTYIDLSRARDHGTFISESRLIQACFDNDATFMADFFLEPNERKEFGHKDDLIGRRVKYDYEEGWKPEECASSLLKGAVLYNANDVIKILLQKTDPCIVDEFEYSPFQYAVIQGKVDTVQVLLDDERTDVNFSGNSAFSPLECAICNGKTDIVKLLLNDERIQILNKASLLHLSESYPEITKLLEKVEETPQKVTKEHRCIRKKQISHLDRYLWESEMEAMADVLDKFDDEETKIGKQSSVRVSHQNGAPVRYDNFTGRYKN